MSKNVVQSDSFLSNKYLHKNNDHTENVEQLQTISREEQKKNSANHARIYAQQLTNHRESYTDQRY